MFCLVAFYNIRKLVYRKNKIVRVVHMNIFYKVNLESCDLKNEFWTKTENNREVEKLKNQLWGPKWTFEGLSKTKMNF